MEFSAFYCIENGELKAGCLVEMDFWKVLQLNTTKTTKLICFASYNYRQRFVVVVVVVVTIAIFSFIYKRLQHIPEFDKLY